MKLTESKIQELIFEEIELMVENGELDEGFLDRLKARAAGAGEKLKGSAKSAVQRGVGAVQGAIGDPLGVSRSKKKAQFAKDTSKQAATNKQALSVMKSYAKKIDKLRKATSKVFEELDKDLEKLGLQGRDLDKLEETIGFVLQILYQLTNQLNTGKLGVIK